MSTRRTKKEKETMQAILKAIPKTGGLLTVVGGKAGVCRQTVAKYRDKYPEIAESIKSAHLENVELALSKVLIKIREGDNQMIMFFLNKYSHLLDAELSGQSKEAISEEDAKKTALEILRALGDE